MNAEWKMTPIPLLAMWALPMPMSHRHILHTVAEAITTFSLSSHYIVVLNSPAHMAASVHCSMGGTDQIEFYILNERISPSSLLSHIWDDTFLISRFLNN